MLANPIPPWHAEDGVTANRMVIGQSAAFSGPASEPDTRGFAVSYTPEDHSGSRFVELTVITKEGKFLR